MEKTFYLKASPAKNGLNCIIEMNRKRLAIVGGKHGQPKNSVIKSHGVFVAHKGDLLLIKDFNNGDLIYAEIVNPKAIVKEKFILQGNADLEYIIESTSDIKGFKSLFARFNPLNVVGDNGAYNLVETDVGMPAIECKIIDRDDRFAEMENTLNDFMLYIESHIGLDSAPYGCFLHSKIIYSKQIRIKNKGFVENELLPNEGE